MTNRDGRSSKDDQIAELRAANMKPAEIAAAVGCSVATVYGKLRDTRVRARVSELRAYELAPIVKGYQTALEKALTYFLEVLDDSEESTRNRLSAAESINAYYLKFADRENVAERVAALEAKVAEILAGEVVPDSDE